MELNAFAPASSISLTTEKSLETTRPPNHLSGSRLLSRPHPLPLGLRSLHQYNSDENDTVVPNKLVNNQSTSRLGHALSSRRFSSSSSSFDDTALNDSDLDELFENEEEEDEDEEGDEDVFDRVRQASSASTVQSPLALSTKTRKRRRRDKKDSESSARYRLECLRERNRLAARKYRQSQKSRKSKLEEEGERLMEERDELVEMVKVLQNEVYLLKHKFLNQVCWNCGQPTV